MNKRYLGDVRDLFKYDLIQRILEGIKSLQGFTFIPMLTEYDPESKGGNKRDFDKAKVGTNNKNLVKSLKKYNKYNKIDPNERDFTEVKKHFESRSFEIRIYEERGNKYFTNIKRSRDEYFEHIPLGLLHKSLVFVDPDNGLQIENSTEKHLLYGEVKNLYKRMDKDSILMIYQQFPREDHEEYLSKRANKLRELTQDLPIYISDNEITFFLLTKNDKLTSQLEHIIEGYNSAYPSLSRFQGDKI